MGMIAFKLINGVALIVIQIVCKTVSVQVAATTARKKKDDIGRIRTCAGEPKRFLVSRLNHSATMS